MDINVSEDHTIAQAGDLICLQGVNRGMHELRYYLLTDDEEYPLYCVHDGRLATSNSNEADRFRAGEYSLVAKNEALRLHVKGGCA